MTVSVSNKEFKKLQKNPILIKKVWNFYRSGYVPAENKFHTYIYFPSSLKDSIVYGEDKAWIKEGDRLELRRQLWNKEDRKFEFHKLTERIDLKLFKKVVDVVAVAKEDFTIEVYDSASKGKIEYLVSAWEEFLIENFSAGKVRDLLDTMDLADDIEVNAETNKRPFDWEDNIRKRLEGKAFTFKVTGAKLETRYTFKEVEAFTPPQSIMEETIAIEDIPFR